MTHGISKSLSREVKDFIAGPHFDLAVPPPADESWPKISVITPSYNQAEFLERTIISIHNQGYPNLEHIIVDGGSDDGSVEIIRKYQHVLAHWVSEPDNGQCDAIDKGAEWATGQYMTWVNSDDLLLPGALDILAGRIKEQPRMDVVYGDQLEIDEHDSVTKRLFTIDFDILDFIYEANIIVHQQSSLWRTELYRKLGGLCGCPYAMDYELFYRMYKDGASFHRVDGYISGFRVYSGSLTGSGEVSRGRDDTLNGIFRDFTGRQPTAFDRSVRKQYWKARRLLTHPKALRGVIENRLYRLFNG
jgi:glycosyltransferase involved in cell wall biosynthesis